MRWTTCTSCHQSQVIFCNRQLIVLPNSSVSSPGRIFWQPYKSPLNLPTSLILRSMRTFFPVPRAVSVVYNSHLRANIWLKHASDCGMVFIPALIIPGFLTSVFNLQCNYIFIFHFTTSISYAVYLILRMGPLQPRGIVLLLTAMNTFHLSFQSPAVCLFTDSFLYRRKWLTQFPPPLDQFSY